MFRLKEKRKKNLQFIYNSFFSEYFDEQQEIMKESSPNTMKTHRSKTLNKPKLKERE